ncbi:hypothetical protein ACJX0J_015059, partial [Zea mays]
EQAIAYSIFHMDGMEWTPRLLSSIDIDSKPLVSIENSLLVKNNTEREHDHISRDILRGASLVRAASTTIVFIIDLNIAIPIILQVNVENILDPKPFKNSHGEIIASIIYQAIAILCYYL